MEVWPGYGTAVARVPLICDDLPFVPREQLVMIGCDGYGPRGQMGVDFGHSVSQDHDEREIRACQSYWQPTLEIGAV
jgi:hypothetical protein